MKSVFITTAVDKNAHVLYDDYEFVLTLCEMSEGNNYFRVDDPVKADMICFVSSIFDDLRDILQNELYKKFRNKCVTIQTRDISYPRLPGVYASISQKVANWLNVYTCCYPRVSCGDYPGYYERQNHKYLYSFVGAFNTCSLRKKFVLLINDKRALIVNTSETVESTGGWLARYNQHDKNIYSESIYNSKFILSPKGVGLSSMRLFEILKAGRVPVIIADGYALPNGPVWRKCSILIKEKDVPLLPKILREKEENFFIMAANARKAWKQYFDVGSSFENLMKECEKSMIYSNRLKLIFFHYFRMFSCHYVRNFVFPVINLSARSFVKKTLFYFGLYNK